MVTPSSHDHQERRQVLRGQHGDAGQDKDKEILKVGKRSRVGLKKVPLLEGELSCVEDRSLLASSVVSPHELGVRVIDHNHL